MLSEKSAPEARLAELLGGAAEVVMELGMDGRILLASSAVERILGRPAHTLVGLSFLELVESGDHDRVLSLFQKMLETGAEPLFRARFAGRDDRSIEFETSLRLFSDQEGDRRIVGVLRDVTERSAEGAAEQSRHAHYRALVERSKSPAAVVTSSSSVLFSNRRFKNAFGNLSALSELQPRVGKSSLRVADEARKQSTRPGGPASGDDDMEMLLEDGTSAWYAVHWEAFRSDEGERRFTVTYEDITQRKKIELALRAIAGGPASQSNHSTQSTHSIAQPSASGVSQSPQTAKTHLRLIERVGEALGLDRLILGTLNPEEPSRLKVVAGWSATGSLDQTEIDLRGLPDEFVARGEVCVHPKGVSQILPAIIDRIGHGYESYAGQPLYSVDGSVIGLLSGYSREPLRDLDLTRTLFSAYATHAAASIDRRRADASARANQDRFETLALHSDDLLAEIDHKGIFTYISEASHNVLGISPADIVGRHFNDLIHADDPRIEAHEYAALLKASASRPHTQRPTQTDGAPESPHEAAPTSGSLPNEAVGAQPEEPRSIVLSRVRHADGELRWLESRVSVFTAFDGAPRALFQARDVTDRRQSEIGREMLYRVVQQGRDLVLVGDRESAQLAFANQAAHQVLARNAKTPIEGYPIADLFIPADAQRMRAEILPQLTEKEPWFGELSLIGTPNEGDTAAEIPTEAAIFFCGQDDSGKRHIAVTLRDISARRLAEEALHESELRLGQSQKMEAVGRLAGGIAHDFNNLLTAIMGYGDLVLDEIGEGHVAHRDMEEILRAAERAGGLTRQLLAFSRRQVLQPESIDLNSVVVDIDRMMRRLIGENIELVTVQAGELQPIIADPGQIEQVIVNLVVNARDAMPSGGRLEIETSNVFFDHAFRTDSGLLEAGQYVKLRVSDTGIGMDKETRAQIFEPFFTTKEVHQGTGLGLATAYGIVSQSGGQIDVESSPGRGSQFTIYLPAAQSELKPDEPASELAATGGDETILLVEDSDPVRHLVSRTLEKNGYTVLSAESATAALRHCSRHPGPIHLLLTDVVLPKTSGPEIARRAAEIRPGVPVLFMSGFTDDTLESHGIHPSHDLLLEKPFTPADLLIQIRAKLEAPERE